MMTTIISDKTTTYNIVIPVGAAMVEQTAAEELQTYLKKVYGTELAILTESDAKGNCFYIGRTEYAKASGVAGKSTENWIIKEQDGNIILTGGEKPGERGIIYAVYHFLEDIVGVRWWSVWDEYIPEATELSLESGFYKEGTPYFKFRKILGCMKLKDFYYDARTRCNVVGDDGLKDGAYGTYPGGARRFGEMLQFARPHHVHTLNRYLPPQEYFEEHPEWFAWSGAAGARVAHTHYCLTNDELCEACFEKLDAIIKEDKKLEKETGVPIPVFYDISFPDTLGGFCQCEKCQELIEKTGPGGYAQYFANKLARKVNEVHPDVVVEALPYAAYLEPPKDGMLAEKNMTIRLAQVFVDLIHDTKNRGNEWYMHLIKEWSELCKKSGADFYIWEYMFNLFVDMPLPVPKRLCETFKTFKEYGVSGIFVENERTCSDMWELVHFMLVQLSENPDLDEETLLNDFIPKFYGAAGVYVREYLELLYSAALENNFSAFCIIESAHFNYIDAKTAVKGMELLDKALEAVKGDSVMEYRVQHLKTNLGGNILVRFFDLKKIAERQGVAFDFDPEALRKMVVSGYELAKTHPRCQVQRVDDQIRYYSNMTLVEETAALPAELSDVNPNDAYQFFYKNSCRHILDMPDYGVSYVEDPDSALGIVQKIQRTAEADPLQMMPLLTTSKYDEYKGGVTIKIQQNAEYIDGVELFRENIVPDEYHLYKIGSATNIGDYGDTRVDIFGNNFEWLSLSGISVAFPMDACDVYLSIKFTGEMYGGAKGSEEAIYLDRAIVVRK